MSEVHDLGAEILKEVSDLASTPAAGEPLDIEVVLLTAQNDFDPKILASKWVADAYRDRR